MQAQSSGASEARYAGHALQNVPYTFGGFVGAPWQYCCCMPPAAYLVAGARGFRHAHLSQQHDDAPLYLWSHVCFCCPFFNLQAREEYDVRVMQLSFLQLAGTNGYMFVRTAVYYLAGP
jgi:hypothetical protein